MSGLTIIDFYAEWCAPCKAMKPVIQKMKVMHPEVKIEEVDSDDNTELVKQYEVSSLPTYVFIKDGEVVHTATGAMSSKILEDLIIKYNGVAV